MFINHFETSVVHDMVRISLAFFHLFFDNIDLATFLPVFDTPVLGTFQKMILAAMRAPPVMYHQTRSTSKVSLRWYEQVK